MMNYIKHWNENINLLFPLELIHKYKMNHDYLNWLQNVVDGQLKPQGLFIYIT